MQLIDTLSTWLVTHGIDTVLVYPGGTCVQLQAALGRRGFRIRSASPELNLAYAAIGYHQTHNKPAAVLTISGPGALNTTAALYAAARLGHPFLLLEGLPATSNQGRLGTQDTSLLGDSSVRVTQHLTGCSHQVRSATDLTRVLPQIGRSLFIERRPAHLAIPSDLVHQDGEGLSDAQLKSEHRLLRAISQSVPTAAIDVAADVLTRAVRPLLFVGGGVQLGDESVRSLLDTFPMPFITTVDAKGTLDEHSPYSCGVALAGNDLGHFAISNADVIVAVGAELGEFELYGWTACGAADQKVIHANDRPDLLGKNFPETYPLPGQVQLVVNGLREALQSREWVPPQPWFSARTELARVPHDQPIAGEEDRLLPTEAIAAIGDLLPTHARVVADIGGAIFAVGHFLRLRPPQRSFCPIATAAVGQSVAAAMGMCLAEDSVTVCVCGDLAFHDAASAIADVMNWYDKGHPIGKIVWVVLADNHSGLVRAGVAGSAELADAVDTEIGSVHLKLDNNAIAGALEFQASCAEELKEAFENALLGPAPAVVVVQTGTGSPPIGVRNAVLGNDQFLSLPGQGGDL